MTSSRGPAGRNGLITRRHRANTYDITPDGKAFAVFYSKVHHRVLPSLFTAGQPQAPSRYTPHYAALHLCITVRADRSKHRDL